MRALIVTLMFFMLLIANVAIAEDYPEAFIPGDSAYGSLIDITPRNMQRVQVGNPTPCRLLFQADTGTIVFDGCNLAVVANPANVTNRGNVVIGQNNFLVEADASLMVGEDNTVHGSGNALLGRGNSNQPDGNWNVVTGLWNTAGGMAASVFGGYSNQAYGEGSAIFAGAYSKIWNVFYGAILGGQNNQLLNPEGSISLYPTIAGGSTNRVQASYSTVLGGIDGYCTTENDTVVGQ